MPGRNRSFAFGGLVFLSVLAAFTLGTLAADELPSVPANDVAAVGDKSLDLSEELVLSRKHELELLTRIQTQRISFNFQDMPLEEAIIVIGERSGIPIIVDSTSLENEGMTLDEPCSVKVQNLRIESAFSRLLKGKALTWVIENEQVQITTAENGGSVLSTQVIAVGDLVNWFRQNTKFDEHRDRFGFEDLSSTAGGMGGGGGVLDQAGSTLIDLVMDFAGGDWEEVDGLGGTMSYEGGLLTVRQTLPVLLRVQRFVKQLRILQQSPPSHGIWAIPEAGFGWPENRKVMAGLRKSITVDFIETPIEDALEQLARLLDVQIEIDRSALEDSGIAADELITLKMNGTASAVLRQLLGRLSLTWMIQDDSLIVTAIEAAQALTFTVMADTRELLASGHFTNHRLSETIEQETSASWVNVDGEGGIVRTVGGLTFVRQTQESLTGISVLLLDMKVRATLAESAEAKRDDDTSDRNETRFYRAESKDDVDSLTTALTHFVFPDTWETNGGNGVILDVGATLVVRQTPAVHTAIAEFISELRSAGAGVTSSRQTP